jgi:hypothetical protein
MAIFISFKCLSGNLSKLLLRTECDREKGREKRGRERERERHKSVTAGHFCTLDQQLEFMSLYQKFIYC